MFARLVKLQLRLLPAFDAAQREALTLPADVFAHGSIMASMGDTERQAVFALRGPPNSRRACQSDQPLRLRLFFARNLYVEASFQTPPTRKGDDVIASCSVEVFKDGQRTLSGPWEGALKVWRPDGKVMSIMVEVRDLNVMLDGADLTVALEDTWILLA